MSSSSFLLGGLNAILNANATRPVNAETIVSVPDSPVKVRIGAM